MGYDIANNSDAANINLIVTCSVKDTTEHKMAHRIKNLSKNNKPNSGSWVSSLSRSKIS